MSDGVPRRDTADVRDIAARTVYFDHAATSWPKPPEVITAVTEALEIYGGNPGRGAYALGLATSRLIRDSRTACAGFLGVPDPKDLIFTSGCTAALNLVLKGLLGPGDRVVTTSMEHNAVSRPLAWLTAEKGVEVVVVEADEHGIVDPDDVERAVRAASTKAVVSIHASNVTGAAQPIADFADIAHEAGAVIVVDGAQAAGHLPVDVGALGVDAYAASGHKALLGPQGIGVLYLAPTLEVSELIQGGTGSGASEEPLQPRSRPDRYEAGTPNTPGIAGLAAGIHHLSSHFDEQTAREAELADALRAGIRTIPGFRVLGPERTAGFAPTVTVSHARVAADQLAFALDRGYGIAARAGLHCAPWAHRTLGTLETGTLRLGLGWSTTRSEVDLLLDALSKVTA